MTKKTLVKHIKKLSPVVQTSSLEGSHSVLNHWHPKMICFPWLGTYCRWILSLLKLSNQSHNYSSVYLYRNHLYLIQIEEFNNMTNIDFLTPRHILACLHFNENTQPRPRPLLGWLWQVSLAGLVNFGLAFGNNRNAICLVKA